MGLPKNTPEKFWSLVDRKGPDECWEWLRKKNVSHGYGTFKIGAYHTTTQRLAWWLTTGEYPSQNVLHRCDNPGCCNPAHLFLGSQWDNVRDMDTKGRRKNAPLSGEAHGNAKVSDVEVAQIQEMYATGQWSQESLARLFGLGQSHVSRIILRLTRTAGHTAEEVLLGPGDP